MPFSSKTKQSLTNSKFPQKNTKTDLLLYRNYPLGSFKIFSGFLPSNTTARKTGYIYCQKITQPSPTIIWIMGGGFATTTLAFSGTGPWIYDTNEKKVIVNPYILDYSQVFLDVAGQGFSSIEKFPKNDEEYVEYWYVAIQSFRQKFDLSLSESILAGVSYGTKTAFQLIQKYRNELNISCYIAIGLAITQYYNYLTIPNTLQYKGLVQYSAEERETLDKILSEFSFYYSTQKYDEMLKYIDVDGIILKYLEGIINQPNRNVWNLALFEKDYDSNKNTVYNIVKDIDIQKELGMYDPNIYKAILSESGTFTVESWKHLCCSPGYSSYVVPIDNNEFFNPTKPIPKLILQGDNDCITNPNYIPLMVREFLNKGIEVSELKIDHPENFCKDDLLANNVIGNQYATGTGIQVKRIFNSGHLVSYDQPCIASRLISNFLRDIYLKTYNILL